MTPSDHPNPESPATTDEVSTEIAVEQAHVDRVYAELAKAATRVALVEAEGLARGRTDRTGDVRDEEITGLFERDALVFHAAGAARRSRRSTRGWSSAGSTSTTTCRGDGSRPSARCATSAGSGSATTTTSRWSSTGARPAAAPFYRATPVEPMGVLRRRVLRCKGSDVVGVEDDLMVPEAPTDLVVVGDGALMAALTRTRGARMRDIVATIQRHQDEAIRAPARGVTEITGGPGTGKTVVALHRAAYLLYSDRRRFESGGILVVGPSGAYTAYIERVLPSLGEETVTLRSLGDVVDGVTTARLDPPAAAAIKGSLRIRRVLARAARDVAPDAPTQLRVFVAGPGDPARVGRAGPGAQPGPALAPAQPRRRGRPAARWPSWPGPPSARATAPSSWTGSATTWTSRRSWRSGGRQLDAARGAAVAGRPRPPVPLRRRGAVAARRSTSWPPRCRPRSTPAPGRWPTSRSSTTSPPGSGLRRRRRARSAAFYEIEELDDVARHGVSEVRPALRRAAGHRRAATRSRRTDPRERLLRGPAGRPRRSTPTCSSTRPRTSRRCSGGCSAVAAGGRRGPSSATPRRPSWPDADEAAPGPRGGLRQPGSARCSTWTPTTATPARSSTTPPR